LPERESTDGTPGFVEVRIFNEASNSRGLATLNSKMTQVAAAQVDHRGSQIGGGIVQRPSYPGNAYKGLLYQFLGVCHGTNEQKCYSNHPVPLRTVQNL
jgi:hypothetical protein